jgi:hypothetical protein
MKNHSNIFLTLFLIMFFAALCGNCGAVEKDSAFEEALTRRIMNVDKQIDQKQYAEVSQLVDYMDEHLGDDTEFYITMAHLFLMRSQQSINDHVWHLWEHVYAKSIKMDAASSPYRLGQQIDIIYSRLRVAKGCDEECSIVRDRQYMSGRMLSCWQDVLSHIDENAYKKRSDPYLLVNVPLSEFKRGFGAGSGPYFWPPAELIDNKEIREKYQKEVEAAQTIVKRANLHIVAKSVLEKKKDGKVVKDFLVEMYSLRPFAAAELESLLTKYKVDEAFAKEILDAVKETEKNAPPPTDFRTWQSKDGLFKTKAKYVASDERNVTLEKEDGKQTTMPLDAMRWSDNNFVRYQLALAEAKTVPKQRTWRSPNGDHEVKATFVSGNDTVIHLKREDGAVITAEVALLSAEDQEYVKRQLAAEKNAHQPPPSNRERQ